MTWNSGLWARLRTGCASLHHLFEGNVLMLLRGQGLPLHLLSSSLTVGDRTDPGAAPGC